MEQKLLRIIYAKFKEEHGFRLSKEELIYKRIKDACKKVIIELNSMDRTEVNIPFITSDSKGPKHIMFSVTKKFIVNYSFKKEEEISTTHVSADKKMNIDDESEMNNNENKFDEKSSQSFFEKHINTPKKEKRKISKSKIKRIILIILIILGGIAYGIIEALPYF